jgi:hypothetical protein
MCVAIFFVIKAKRSASPSAHTHTYMSSICHQHQQRSNKIQLAHTSPWLCIQLPRPKCHTVSKSSQTTKKTKNREVSSHRLSLKNDGQLAAFEKGNKKVLEQEEFEHSTIIKAFLLVGQAWHVNSIEHLSCSFHLSSGTDVYGLNWNFGYAKVSHSAELLRYCGLVWDCLSSSEWRRLIEYKIFCNNVFLFWSQ